MKNNQNDEKDHWCPGCCHRKHLESLAAKPSLQHTSQRLWLRPSRCSSWKCPDCHQLAPPPQSRTFNGGNGVKAIYQASYSPNTATADFFLLQRDEVRASGPLDVSWRGWRVAPEPSAKMSPLQPFGGVWTSAKSMSESAWTRPQKVLK